MKIIILIIASKDSEHESDLLCQQKTWVSKCHGDVTVIYLRGWDRNYYFEDKNVLYVPCREEYSQILTKTILGLMYINSNYNFDIVIRTNVSTYFETHKMVKELNKQKYNGSFYGGYIDQSTEKIFDIVRTFEYISGAGIFLSKDVVSDLISLKPESYIGIADDIAISSYLFNLRKKRIRIARNNLQSTHFFIPTFYIRTKNSFDSNSASKRMILIHEYFQKKGNLSRTRSYFKIAINECREFMNHPEEFKKYMAKNRVVLLNFIKLKLRIT
jgi:hypothetical protein